MTENSEKIRLTKRQKEHWERICNLVHDESLNCRNMISMIDILFPEVPMGANQFEVVKLLKTAIRPYLEMRADLGQKAMELIYEVDAKIDR